MRRGTLRVYLGAAPGVGKTCAMLAEGHRRQSRGTDIVVAICETHERTYTAQLLQGLEVVPRKVIEHRGARLTELDLDAVIARAPQVALVDELAHTNAPGAQHAKRWQDVEALLEAGIDVISTVNIQHLASLNDAVTAITGVVQRETVPDAVVRAADQVELVDMSPHALRRRMAHGNVYRPERVDAALSNYFREGNLAALRELALLWLADRVDEALEHYRHEQGIDSSWPARNRVVVALTGGAEGPVLARRAARIASRGAGGELLAVFVARSDGLAGSSPVQVSALRALVEELGGTFHTVTGDDVGEAILDFARGVNAGQIVVGSSARPRWQRMLSPGVGEAVVARSGEIDVHVVTTGASARQPRQVSPTLSATRRRAGWALGLLGPPLATLLLRLPGVGLELPLIVELLLAYVVLVALVGGLWPAVVAALACSLLVNWFFTPPLDTLTIADPQNVVALVVFVVVAVAVSTLVNRLVRRTQEAFQAQSGATAFGELALTLLSRTDQMSLLLQRAVATFDSDRVELRDRGTGQVLEAARAARDASSSDDPAAQTEAATGAATGDVPTGSTVTVEQVDDDHELVLHGAVPPPRLQGLLTAYAAHAGAILSRRQLQATAHEADALARDNRARTAILSAVSHDLRTPLAGIKAAVSGLRATDVQFSAQDRADLEATIEECADRLDALIADLLDASRLQAGQVSVHPRAMLLDQALPVHPAAAGLTVDRAAAHVRLWADPGLLERVLANLVENAQRHAPGTVVRLDGANHEGRAVIRVVDTGPGLPPGESDRLFEPFQRRGDDQAGSGVGLGLSIARGLTEAMSGTLVAEDTPGGGVTMVVDLPAQAPTEPDGDDS